MTVTMTTLANKAKMDKNLNNKRTRLVEAADQLFHEQGVNVTTLANIADLANVPLGNVYYYFKSKDSIIEAVIDFRKKQIEKLFASWNSLGHAKARLQAFIEHFLSAAEKTATSGDALGGLAYELSKQGGNIALSCANLLKEMVDWCEKQFAELGKGEKSAMMALNLVAALQGVSLLTAAFKDPNYLTKQGKYLISWLENPV